MFVSLAAISIVDTHAQLGTVMNLRQSEDSGMISQRVSASSWSIAAGHGLPYWLFSFKTARSV